MSRSDPKPASPGILREYALDILSPVVFSLLLMAFLFVMPDPRILFITLLPLGTASAGFIVLLRRFLNLRSENHQVSGSRRKHIPHFINLLHLQHHDSFETGEDTEEFEVVLGTQGQEVCSADVQPGLHDLQEEPGELMSPDPGEDAWGEDEDDETMTADPEEEAIIQQTGDYVATSLDRPHGRFHPLDIRKNEIASLRKKIPLPPLRQRKDPHLPWSDGIPTFLITDEETEEPGEMRVAVEVPGQEEDVVEAEIVYPETEESPEELQFGVPVVEGLEIAFGESPRDVDVEPVGKARSFVFEEAQDLLEQPEDYFGNWHSLSIRTKNYTIPEDSSYFHNPNYTLYKCSCCGASFTSSKGRPHCPRCEGRECLRI